MNLCREAVKMGVPPGNRRVLVSVPEWYVAGANARGPRKGGHIHGRSNRFINNPG